MAIFWHSLVIAFNASLVLQTLMPPSLTAVPNDRNGDGDDGRHVCPPCFKLHERVSWQRHEEAVALTGERVTATKGPGRGREPVIKSWP